MKILNNKFNSIPQRISYGYRYTSPSAGVLNVLNASTTTTPNIFLIDFIADASTEMIHVLNNCTAAGSSFSIDSFGVLEENGTNTLLAMMINTNGDVGYRFSFNGMMKDNEIKGSGNSLDFGARIYDSRLGKWMSLDPLMGKYPSFSAYCFVGNMPIIAIDPNGKEIYFINNNSKDNKYLKAAFSTLLKTESGKALYNKYAKNQNADIYINVASTPGAYAWTYMPLTFTTSVKDNKTGEVKQKRLLSDPYLNDLGAGDFKNIDISKSGNKQVYFIQFDSKLLETSDVYEEAETIFHEIKAHIELKMVNKQGERSNEGQDHTAYGVKYTKDKKGKIISATIIPGSFADKIRKQLEKVKTEKEKKKPVEKSSTKKSKQS